MKEKLKKLTTDLKKFHESHYGMIILVSWFVLLVCLVIKLFGGNWFELGTENSKFIEFCNYVDSNMILKMILASLICLGSTYFIMCLLLNKNKLTKKDMLIYFPLIIVGSLLGWLFQIINTIIQLIYLIILPIIQTRKWKRVLIINILIFVFQLISIIFRNFSTFDFNNNTTLFSMLIQIDYYIMLILYYLYTFKRKEMK